jgi:hypothetical protein
MINGKLLVEFKDDGINEQKEKMIFRGRCWQYAEFDFEGSGRNERYAS